MKNDWYKNAQVIRHRENGQLKYIEVKVPYAFGKVKSAQVRPGDANEFLADVIVGLLYELEKRDTQQPQNNQIRFNKSRRY